MGTPEQVHFRQDPLTVFRRPQFQHFGNLVQGREEVRNGLLLQFGLLSPSQKDRVAQSYIDAALGYFRTCGNPHIEAVGNYIDRSIQTKKVSIISSEIDTGKTPLSIMMRLIENSRLVGDGIKTFSLPAARIIDADDNPIDTLAALLGAFTEEYRANSAASGQDTSGMYSSEQMQVALIQHIHRTHPHIPLPVNVARFLTTTNVQPERSSSS